MWAEVSGPAAAAPVFVREGMCCCDTAVKSAEERAGLANASTSQFQVKEVRVGTL